MPLRLSLLLQLWGGGVALSQDGPPAVSPGTAADTCQRILDAGYSPHDYIYRVISYNQRPSQVDPGIDYFHGSQTYLPRTANSFVVKGLAGSVGGTFRSGLEVVGYEIILREYEVLVDDDASPPQSRGDKLGEILDINGQAVDSGGLVVATYQGLDAYIWRPADGSADVIYRDRQPVDIPGGISAGDTEWVFDFNWDGPEAARMSSIWGSVSACAQ